MRVLPYEWFSAASLDLEVIPLIQTFGHLEWLLKTEQFVRFRENVSYPMVSAVFLALFRRFSASETTRR